MSWQPIETAPKDGTEIIARRFDNTPFIIFYRSTFYFTGWFSITTDNPVTEPIKDWTFKPDENWQPLKTAPTDGTWVLVNDAECFYYDGGMASGGTYGKPLVANCHLNESGPCWGDSEHGAIGGDVMTGWMPLPEPPKEEV